MSHPYRTTPHAILKRGLWAAADCDLMVLAHVPPELAFSIVAGILTRNRDELARSLERDAEDHPSATAVRDEIPDLAPVAEILRQHAGTTPPSPRTLDRLTWRLRRASAFLEKFAPQAALDDAVTGDRLLDILRKVAFLTDLLDDWRAPRTAARRRTG